MNFFDAQDKARRTTRRLVLLYVLAAVSIVAGVTLVVGAALYNFSASNYAVTADSFVRQQAPVLIGTAIAAALLIVGATGYKTAALSSGGSRVALDLGGTLVAPDVQDPLRRRLLNVVEEIAIASGVPVPDVFVLEHEIGINAFAAGYTPGDAAITVTRGALELLNRDELQGVIAHEFSHILNGDMRLNIRLMGVLFGIMVIALIGRTILRGARWGAFSSRRDRGAPVVLIIGLGLTVLGSIGIFFARMIKASVSRQREFLADASAVQFTRQTDGIANALKKIGGYGEGSYLRAADPEEVSHMLFGAGSGLGGLFATHPPLLERIRALDPGFRPADYPVVDRRMTRNMADDSRAAGLHGGTPAVETSAPANLAEGVAERFAGPDTPQVRYAERLRETLPALLYDAAHSQELAYLLSVALTLDTTGAVSERQFGIIRERLGEQRTRLVRQYHDELTRIGARYRLPLIEIAFPALKRRPAPELAYLIDLVGRLIEADGDVDLHEYCYYRILVSGLRQSAHPAAHRKLRKPSREPVRNAAIELLRIVAKHGNDSSADQARAFAAGKAVFGPWADRYDDAGGRDVSVPRLDESLETLLALNGAGKTMLIEAVTAVVMHDRTLTLAEAELVRAVCASLDCPMPPIVLDL